MHRETNGLIAAALAVLVLAAPTGRAATLGAGGSVVDRPASGIPFGANATGSTTSGRAMQVPLEGTPR